MSFYSAPPPIRPFSDDKPTLLVCWWITAFCTTFILLRITGRLVRVEKLFLEDKLAAAALLPLFLRMALVHVILLYGTNNVDYEGLNPTAEEVRRRVIGSRLVLASRIFYPATLWTMKAGTLEFLSRLKPMSRQRTFSRALWTLRGTLVVSFLAVVISDLAECQPVAHYWQVLPDPGPRCRQGYASLLTTTVCNVLTELLLVTFPIPILLTSRIPGPRKALLIALFCLGLFTVVVSIRRVPQIISEGGYQSTRTMWASCEILVATVAANTLALASFVRDLGAKKAKFKINPYFSSSSQKRAAPIYETWNERASIGENGTAFGHSANIQSNKTISTEMQNMGESKSRGPSPTWSQDSLIPKGQKNQSLAQVTKTTEIEVTVEEIGGIKREASLAAPISRLTRREPSPSVHASDRGQARGSTVLLQEMDRFPGQDRDQDGL